MSKPVVTEREVRLARAFLHYLQGNEGNGYLLLAVIAWGRLQARAKDPFWKGLSGYSAKAAGIRLAKRLLTKEHKSPAQYKGLMKVLRRRDTKDAGQQEQALSFMLVIEKSNYDSKHYGYREAEAGYWATQHSTEYGDHTYWVPAQDEYDPMYKMWATLTGHPIPPKWFQDGTVKTVTKKAVPPRPSQPRSLKHVLPQRDYILPYAAMHFYDERPHLGDWVLPV